MKKKKIYIIENMTLMQEWFWEKNSELGINPNDISYGSATKVWWKCENGHEWQSTPNHRSRGDGCPICAHRNRYISKTKNWLNQKGSLADLNPKLANEWHPTKNGELTPKDVTVNNGRKVWWKCENGHEWEAIIKSRNHGVGCPICSGHKIMVGYNDLATVSPKLSREWHPTKNGELTPLNVTISNGRKVWWKCEKGHEWQATIANRSSGCECPICSGHKVLVGYNDLQTINPKLASEWHPTKNGDLLPIHVTANSNKKVWWKCEKGHEWNTAIAHRNKGTNCPICASEIQTSFPEQAIYYYLSKVTKALNRYKVNQNIEIDIYLPELNLAIEYDGIYFHNSEEAKNRELKKNKTLKSLNITLIRVKESVSATESLDNNIILCKPGPTDNQLSEFIKVLVDYINNLKGINLLVDVNINRDRSSIYNQYILLEKENSLLSINPEIAKEWHPTKNGNLLPEHVSYSSNKKVWWKCEKGHEWEANVNSRNKGIGCPYCAGKKAIIGINDLATVNPEIAKEWHPTKNGDLLPIHVTANSNKKVWWKCEKGHEYESIIYDKHNGNKCPICSGKKVLVGYNDLNTVNPRLSREWHPTKNGNMKATDVTVGSSRKVWWQCEKGHEWEAFIYSRNKGTGCPYCAGQKAIIGINDLQTTNPKLASEWHPTKNGGLLPIHVMKGTNKKVWWKCEKGHEWEASVSSRNSGRGCPYCYRRKK